jgi:hypothetical protein
MHLRRLMPLLILPVVLGMSLAPADNSAAPPCLMRPARLEIHLPDRGFHWLKDEEDERVCGMVPAQNWTRGSAGPDDLVVYANGPAGSGRYWTVTVGVGGSRDALPTRGVCFTTSTVGWRTLQHYRNGPLPWLEDLDHDGKAEVIVWESFPLHEEATMAEFGLVAWVYRLAPAGTLSIDWKLTRQMAGEIAAAYRKPLDRKDALQGKLRLEAAEALEQFASDGCRVPPIDGEK